MENMIVEKPHAASRTYAQITRGHFKATKPAEHHACEEREVHEHRQVGQQPVAYSAPRTVVVGWSTTSGWFDPILTRCQRHLSVQCQLAPALRYPVRLGKLAPTPPGRTTKSAQRAPTGLQLSHAVPQPADLPIPVGSSQTASDRNVR